MQYKLQVQNQDIFHRQSNLVNSRLSVVGLQVLLYLRLARSKPAKTAVATWQDLFKMENKTNTKAYLANTTVATKQASFFISLFKDK